MQPFAIAGIQMTTSALHENVTAMKTHLDILMQIYPWVQMVVFSELAPHGPFLQNAQALPGPTEQAFQEMAAKHRIWLIPGTMFEKSGGKIYNTLSVINPQGTVVGRYRKLFPFLPYEQGVEPGDGFLVFDVPNIGRFGVLICYDMWFPETTRTVVSMGAEVIIHPTLTTTIDREIELNIARASAAQNQCFFFDINGCGDGGNGQSIIVGPAGDVLHQAGPSDEMIPLEIDLDRVRRSREVGLRGLGQPLKSFRDRKVHFGLYESPAKAREGYLGTLGPLKKMERGSRAGLATTGVPHHQHAAGLDVPPGISGPSSKVYYVPEETEKTKLE